MGGIDVHDVRRADINAVSAAVATSHINKCRHNSPLTPVSKVGCLVVSGLLPDAAEDFWFVGGRRQIASKAAGVFHSFLECRSRFEEHM